MRILILGATGLIGNNIFRYLNSCVDLHVTGTYRSDKHLSFFTNFERDNLLFYDFDQALPNEIFKKVKPDVVINLIAITKHVKESFDIPRMIQINSVFPHFLAKLCEEHSAKLIQISTDCVFSGGKGNYSEDDLADDLTFYGRSKALGEVTYGGHLTIRTSAIGRELETKYGLVEWFLSENYSCFGYEKAIFTGLTARYLAHVILEHVLPCQSLSGLYHLSVNPINKFDLLSKLAKFYKKDIDIIPDSSIQIDRSLNSDSFKKATGFIAPSWDELIDAKWL